ncbi:pectinesterase family protein [Asticcacaulis machinosus]|uniref:Pectinesterase family protein n=1 Tax=Asticcacaulis machinosus TaxID=2984211 RepID=A0ABT5HIC3_9CAUL|nr:pectinesterase family protein [Asticcacaulis machinosus]MDC7675895.1 pectinesterase family protein [Asticcacaulis machinosus]
MLRAACLTLFSAALALAAPAMADVQYTVSPSCGEQKHCFASLQSALDTASADTSDQWIKIRITAGDYYEKVTISRHKIRLIGAGPDQTRLHFDAVAETAGKYHRRNWGTPGSATLTINADQVTVEGLMIENTFDYLSNDALPDADPKKISNSQGVAVLLDIDSDRVLMRDTALLGYQDTLFANGKRAVIRDSLIAGNIDFIFGNGQLLIEDSEIRTRNRAVTIAPGEFHSYLLAPSTPLSQPVGIVVYRSKLTREAGVPDLSVALGRPWHPTTTFADGRYADPNAVGQASFIDCVMGSHIHPDHWTSMNGTARDGTKTAVFHPQDSRFYETGSTGPGAPHRDIGITWKDGLDIKAVRRHLFTGWPQASHP